MPKPKASFLLPAYKAERYIALTIKSLSAQTCPDFEIIAVDDGSPDKTGKILDDLARNEPRLKVIHQENRGQAPAMNRGLAECSAPYVALIDADDLCLPLRLERQLAFMEAHPEVTACGTAVQFIDSAGAPLAIETNPAGHEEIEALLRDFKLHVARQRLADLALTVAHLIAPLLRLFFAQFQIAFLNQPLDQLIEHFFELRAFVLAVVLGEHFLNLKFAEQVLLNQPLQQRRAQGIERRVYFATLARPVVIVVVAGLEQRVGQCLHQVAEVERRDIEAVEF